MKIEASKWHKIDNATFHDSSLTACFFTVLPVAYQRQSVPKEYGRGNYGILYYFYVPSYTL
jgi:hypothetical protein